MTAGDPFDEFEQEIKRALRESEKLLRETEPPLTRVYLDDSGDGGFKLDSGSSECLVMAACVFRRTEHIEQLDTAITEVAQRHRHRNDRSGLHHDGQSG